MGTSSLYKPFFLLNDLLHLLVGEPVIGVNNCLPSQCCFLAFVGDLEDR